MRRLYAMLAATIVACGFLAASASSAAAQGSRTPLIGLLSPAGPNTGWFAEGFRQGMKELGYIEGQNIRIEFRWAHGQFERLPSLAAELVQLNVDVIVAAVTQASLAAKGETPTIPIVMAGVGDPVGVGLVASLARPGGNVTGTSNMSADVVGKQLELLKEVDPAASRVAVLWNPANAEFQSRQRREAEAAAERFGMQLQFFDARGPQELDAAFAAIREVNHRALLILGDPVFTLHRAAISELVAKARLIAVSGNREFVEAGGLMAYGPSYFQASRRAAAYVDKILKGAKPADLPIEQATNFETLVNLKTARAIGVELPQALLARADEVIE